MPRPQHAAELRRLGGAEASDPAFLDQATRLLAGLVSAGAALGWVDPPSGQEVSRLLGEVGADTDRGAGCLVTAWAGSNLAGLGYWRRYARPTHRPHADLEKIAVAPASQGRGVGRDLMIELISAAVSAEIEVLTLDFRGDNERAARLYQSLGFSEYGRLRRFVAVGSARFDKVLYALDLRCSPTAGAGRGDS